MTRKLQGRNGLCWVVRKIIGQFLPVCMHLCSILRTGYAGSPYACSAEMTRLQLSNCQKNKRSKFHASSFALGVSTSAICSGISTKCKELNMLSLLRVLPRLHIFLVSNLRPFVERHDGFQRRHAACRHVISLPYDLQAPIINNVNSPFSWTKYCTISLSLLSKAF